jgi:hypothetical protein
MFRATMVTVDVAASSSAHVRPVTPAPRTVIRGLIREEPIWRVLASDMVLI